MGRHNGWANYDTWLVVVWLSNDERNYHRMRSLNRAEIDELLLDDIERAFYYGSDKEVINFDNVDMYEIKGMMLEELE